MENTDNIHKINWINAIVAGILGTLVFDIVGFLFTGEFWDTAKFIGVKTKLGLGYGVFGHYMNGVLLAVLYAGIAPSLWGPSWLRTLLFVLGETFVLVWLFLYPVLGLGIGGIDKGIMATLTSLVKHVLYGVPVWYFIHKFKR